MLKIKTSCSNCFILLIIFTAGILGNRKLSPLSIVIFRLYRFIPSMWFHIQYDHILDLHNHDHIHHTDKALSQPQHQPHAFRTILHNHNIHILHHVHNQDHIHHTDKALSQPQHQPHAVRTILHNHHIHILHHVHSQDHIHHRDKALSQPQPHAFRTILHNHHIYILHHVHSQDHIHHRDKAWNLLQNQPRQQLPSSSKQIISS